MSDHKLKWEDVRMFLAICRAGTFAEAARSCGIESSTLRRRIEALEADMQAVLFNRDTRGAILTEAGLALQPYAERAEALMFEAERAVHGWDTQIEGRIRLASSDGFGPFWITPRLGPFLHMHPAISIDMVCAGQDPDLAQGEADLILRLGRATQDDLKCRTLGAMPFQLYASALYLGRHGVPSNLADLLGCGHHAVALKDTTHTEMPEPGWREWDAFRRQPGVTRFEANSSAALVQATLAGHGISLMLHYADSLFPALVRIDLGDWQAPSLPVIILYHERVKRQQRVMLLIDYLVELCRDAFSAGGGVNQVWMGDDSIFNWKISRTAGEIFL